MRKLLVEIFTVAEGVEIAGTAADAYEARDMIKRFKPDVVTLDIEMPGMDGLTFLENVMRLRPLPVVMVSTLTERGSQTTLKALEIGAVDFVTKPKFGVAKNILDVGAELVEKVKIASQANLNRVQPLLEQTQSKKQRVPPVQSPALLALGASTGGTEAIRVVLSGLASDCPPIVVVQHIPPRFSAAFAERLDKSSAMHVKEAEDGEIIESGHVYIAPGDLHVAVQMRSDKYVITTNSTDKVNNHRPSVDVLFDSVANKVGKHVLGVLLTGMGQDGAKGLLAIRQAGGQTIAQDEDSSVVWGMPKEAVRLGAAQTVCDLTDVSSHIQKWWKDVRRRYG